MEKKQSWILCLRGHQEEEGEYDATIGFTYTRKLKAKKRKRRERQITYLTGVNLDHLLLQSVQLVLRRQIYALIHDLGFPPEIEQVAREYWTLYLVGLRKYKDDSQDIDFTSLAGDDDRSDLRNKGDEKFDGSESTPEVETRETSPEKQQDRDRFKDKAVAQEKNPDVLDTLNEYQSDDSESSSDESNEYIEENFEDQSEESGSDEEEMDKKHDDSPQLKNKEEMDKEYDGKSQLKNKRYWPTATAKALTLSFTIAICYISAQHLKLPVVYGDFYRWIMHRKIPYYEALDGLPPEMTRRLGLGRQVTLLPSHKSTAIFQTAARKLLVQYRTMFGLTIDMPNVPPLIFRFTQELMLPIEVYTSALRLSRVLLSILGSPEKILWWRRRKDFSWETSIPNFAMAVVILVAKLFFGLDGKRRSADNRLSWINSLPKEHDWMRALDVYDNINAQTSIPTVFGEFEELIQVNPDLYSEYCKKAIRTIPGKDFNQVVGVFQTTDYAQKISDYNGDDRISLSIEAFIKKLYSGVPPPDEHTDEDNMEPPPLRHGEGFVHYRGDSVDVYLGRYERLLAYASNILCIKPSSLQEEVSIVEEILVAEPNIMRPFK
ncbi:Pol I core factor CF [Entomortierella chlamydospora]|nr:Pol I core factor CF [Entomortierella chlamydospora]